MVAGRASGPVTFSRDVYLVVVWLSCLLTEVLRGTRNVRLEKLSNPNALAVKRSAAKDHLRIEQDEVDYDTDLDSLIYAAQSFVESETHNTLLNTTYKACWDTYTCPNEGIAIPGWPVNQIISVEYKDTDGVTQTLAPSMYQVNKVQCPAKIFAAPDTTWPETQVDNRVDGFCITFSSGYGSSAEDVPWMFQAMIKLLVASWFKNREAVGQLTHKIKIGFDALRDQVRVNEWTEFLKK